MIQYAYGVNVLTEVFRSSRRRVRKIWIQQGKTQEVREIVSEAQACGVPVVQQPKQDLDQWTKGASHQGVVFDLEPYPYVSLEELIHQAKPLVLCDSLQDPQNLGSICRSALCFGMGGIILPKDRSVEITPAVMKASVGACEHIKIAKVTNLVKAMEELKEDGYWVYAADVQGQQFLPQIDFDRKSAIVLGSEGKGIRPLVLKNADVKFKIPMVQDFDSLNVAQASTVIFYDLSQKLTAKQGS